MAKQVNQFEMLWHLSRDNTDELAELAGGRQTIDSTDGTLDIYRKIAIDQATPHILTDHGAASAIKTGYVLRTNEKPDNTISNSVYNSSPHEKIARCMILHTLDTYSLPFPESYDKTVDDRAIINTYPGFRYPASMGGDIVRGSRLLVQYFPGAANTKNAGYVIGREEIDPIILADYDKANSAAGAFSPGRKNPAAFLYETLVPPPPRTTEQMQASNSAKPDTSPYSTYVIDRDYFAPSRFKKHLQKAVNSLDDAVKPRFARAIKKFIERHYEDGYDIKTNYGHRSEATQRRLYDRYQAGQGGVAAYPGHSWHNYGAAVDIAIIKPTGPGEYVERYKGYVDPGTNEIYLDMLRKVMITERLYNPIDGVNTEKADPGHFQPIELPITPPWQLRQGRVLLAELVSDPAGAVKV